MGPGSLLTISVKPRMAGAPKGVLNWRCDSETVEFIFKCRLNSLEKRTAFLFLIVSFCGINMCAVSKMFELDNCTFVQSRKIIQRSRIEKNAHG